MVGWLSLYVLGLVLIYLFQARLVFAPTVLSPDYKFDFNEPFEEAYLDSELGHRVHYLKFKQKKPSALILYFHGNGGALDSWGHLAEKISIETNADVWMMDYPGYGKSSKSFAGSGEELVEIGAELLERVREERPNLPLVLFGRSLGTGVASALSADAAVAGLILETPYFTSTRLAKEMFPVVPSFIFEYELDNTKMKKSRLPKILVLHGLKDKVIPYKHSADLKAAIGERVQFVTFPNGGHNNLTDLDEYWKVVKAYLSTATYK